MEHRKIVLIGASFSTQNMGVWALASGTISSVLHCFPKAEVYLVDYSHEPAVHMLRHPGGLSKVPLVNIRFSKKVFLQNNIARLLVEAFLLKLVSSKKLRAKIVGNSKCLNIISQADLVVSIAGGDSFSDIYGLGRLIYVALPQILALVLGKPLVLLPQTIGPFKGAFAKTIAAYILMHARMIYSRDFESLETAKDFIGKNTARLDFCYDMGFVLEPQIAEKRIPGWLVKLNPTYPLVGFNVSGLLYIGGYNRNNMFGLRINYRQLIMSLINHLIREYNAQIMLLPHVFGVGNSSESDLRACREILLEAEEDLKGHLHLLEEGYNQHELKALIGRCDFFLGSRMHACIGAFSQCVPAVGLAYSKKFFGVFKSIGMEELVIDLRGAKLASVIENVDLAYQRRMAYRAQLETKIPTVLDSVLGLFNQFHIEPNR